MRHAKLPPTLTIALGQYFLNVRRTIKHHLCVTVHPDHVIETYKDGHPCQRHVDVERVAAVAEVFGYVCHRRDDEFVFEVTTTERSSYYRVTEQVWPLAEVVRPKRKN